MVAWLHAGCRGWKHAQSSSCRPAAPTQPDSNSLQQEDANAADSLEGQCIYCAAVFKLIPGGPFQQRVQATVNEAGCTR